MGPWAVYTPSTVGKAFLNLSDGYIAYQKANVCEDIVLPKVTIEGGDQFDKLMDDRKLQAAIEWMTKQRRGP